LYLNKLVKEKILQVYKLAKLNLFSSNNRPTMIYSNSMQQYVNDWYEKKELFICNHPNPTKFYAYTNKT